MIEAFPPGDLPASAQNFAALPAPRWVAAEAAEFPRRLRAIPQPPDGIWLRTVPGATATIELWRLPSVAIVGARAASAAGMGMARTLGWEAARAGALVVSGLARGIDGAAHEGALLAGGATVAVLACGLATCYPAEHTGLAAEIAASGALLSEWGGREAPLGWRFPRRNRLVSGLVDLVVLVEGGARSGALHTVRFALDQGREVMAVPRDPCGPGAQAPNRLLRDGAAPVTGAADLLSALQALAGSRERSCAQCRTEMKATPACAPAAGGRQRSDQRPAARGERAPARSVSGLPGRLLGHLAREGRLAAESLTARLPEVATARVLAALTTLEVEGRVTRDRMGRYLLVSAH